MFCKPIIPSIPTVYRSALDYASQLCMLSSEVQRVAQEVENLTAVTEDDVVSYVAQQLDPVKSQLQELRNSTESRFAAQAAQIAQHIRRALAPAWVADTQRRIHAMGLWPSHIQYPPHRTTQEER